MQIWGLTEEQIHEAMYRVNEVYGHLIYNRSPEKVGRAYRLTLRMLTSDSVGAAMSDPRNIYGQPVGTPRKSVSADWDVHGAFMAAIYSIADNARIKTAQVDLHSYEDFFEHYPPGIEYY